MTNSFTRRVLVLSAALTVFLLGLPLLGARLAGRPVFAYLEFPPVTHYVVHAGFSWVVFLAMAAGIALVLLPFEWRVWRSRHRYDRQPPSVPFPWWGRFGVLAGVASWVLAWTRFEWFRPFQLYTFSLQWFSFILVINALRYRRTGHCMLIDRPRFLAGLFVLSAVFWWFFEYLNRFVQNWYYVRVADFSPWEYFVMATLPFSTVLPAVLGTAEWLQTDSRVGAGLSHFVRIPGLRRPSVGWSILVAGALGLAGIAIYPDWLYPLLWIAPLLVLVGLEIVLGLPSVLDPVQTGNWRRLYTLALASLVCGFFWEMWNFHSLAKWVYAVPFVGRFHCFEMPVLGYAGYLPFGLECAAVADLLARLCGVRPAAMKGDGNVD